MLVQSLTVSKLFNKISGTRNVINHFKVLHAIRTIFVFVSVLPPIGIICIRKWQVVAHEGGRK